MKTNLPCRTALVALAAILYLDPSSAPAQPPAEPKSFIPQLMKEALVPGLSLALVNEGSFRQFSFGVKNAATGEPVTDSTVFEAASLSKPVFAYAVLKLADSGQVELDVPLVRYLPGDYVENDPRVRRITARMVLSHTTGFPNWRPRGSPLVILFDPGDRFSYSGEGYVYLQKVIERLTGEPLAALMKRLVFDPLGMSASSYVWQESYETQSATGHDLAGLPVEKRKPTEANAAASLHTTAGDYAKFVAAVLDGTGLKEATIGQMLTPQVKLDASCVNCTQRKPERLSDALAWGLGWGLQRTDEGESFWHWGDNGAFRCYVVGFRKQRRGLVLFTNSTNGLSIHHEIIARTIAGKHPALAWIHYQSYDSPGFRLLAAVVQNGAETAIARYRQANPALRGLDEGQINDLGYQLLRTKRVGDALEVFKLNVEAFPGSANAYDSLGEAYIVKGEKELAIKNYQRSVELNPGNASGVEALKKLREDKRD